MRVLRFLPITLTLFLIYPLWAQQTSNPQTGPPFTPTRAPQSQPNMNPSPAPQDSQAVSVLNQALSAAGGAQAIKAVTDYTGSGNITYHWNQDVQGTVTVTGGGSVNIRLDATLPSGVRSWAIHEGQTTLKKEDGKISQLAATNPNVPTSDAFPYQTPLFPSSLAFPYRQLGTVLSNPSFAISYRGVVQVDGHSAADIQVQRVSVAAADPMNQYHAREFFIDTSTLQIVMTQDFVPKNVAHQIHYSDYRAISGVLVPFAITEKLGGQPISTIQLSQITFNSGLQDSAFVLQ